MLLFTPDSIPAAEPFGLYATQRLPSVSRLLRRPSIRASLGPGQTPLTAYAHRRSAEALRELTSLLIGPLRDTRRIGGGSHQVCSPASAGSS